MSEGREEGRRGESKKGRATGMTEGRAGGGGGKGEWDWEGEGRWWWAKRKPGPRRLEELSAVHGEQVLVDEINVGWPTADKERVVARPLNKKKSSQCLVCRSRSRVLLKTLENLYHVVLEHALGYVTQDRNVRLRERRDHNHLQGFRV